MPIQGNIRDINLTSLFNLLNLGNRTGLLTVVRKVPDRAEQNPDVRAKAPQMEYAKIAFYRGNLVYASVSSYDNRLATLLQKSGKLTESQARSIHQQPRQISDKALAMRLMGSRLVGQKDIVEAVQAHTLKVLYTVMAWEDGQFRFANNVKLASDLITVPIDLKNILIGWARETKHLAEINAVVPDLDATLRLPQNPRMKFKGIHLSVEEWKVVANIDPRYTIRQIMRHLNISEIEIKKLIYGLSQANLVYIVPAKPKRDAVRSGRRSRSQYTTQPDKSVINRLIAWVKS